jgi:hypothetical protein
MIVVPSRKQPSSSSSTLIASRKTSGDISVPASSVLKVRGMFSEVTTKLKTMAPAISMPIDTVTRALLRSAT